MARKEDLCSGGGRMSGLLRMALVVGLLSWTGCRDEPTTPVPGAEPQQAQPQAKSKGKGKGGAPPVAEHRSTRGRPGDPPPALMRLGAPNPMTSSPAKIAAFVQGVSGPEQALTTFMYGEYCGWTLELERLVEIGTAIPDHVQTEFFDGAAHGYRPEGFETANLIAKIQGAIPDSYQRFFHDGVLRSYTEKVQGDPEKVVDFSSDYASRVEGYGPFNGVRVGLQRSFGNNISDALKKAAEYPDDFQPALFEELGWRVGDGHDLSRLATEGLAKLVPENSECVFAQGVARGYVLRSEMKGEIDWNVISKQLTEHVEPICARGAWRGLGWAVELTSAHQPGEFSRRLSWLTDARKRAWAEEAMAASGTPAWELDAQKPEE